ncbi:MAG: PTS alpha-glucoside transporter subunit IIBC [Patescibacteria group bacterium]
MDVIIVCHTELGFVSNKRIIFEKKSTQGVKDGVANLVKLAKKYGAKITFAVCPEVVDLFPKNTGHEVGLHIHPGWEEFSRAGFKWHVGDMYLKEHCPQSSVSTVMQDHPYSEQFNMIKTGKEYIKSRLGVDPKVFAAGRWSLNNDTIKVLAELGFTHDCSAYPGFKLSYLDWSKLPRICMPYKPSADDYQNKGGLPILMVPVSRMFLRGAAGPEDAPKYGFSWLKACFKEYYKQGAPLFHIALHSPVMTDPCYISLTDDFFSFISKYDNINFKFTSEIKEYPTGNFKTKILPYVSAFNKEIAKTIVIKLFTR